MIDRSKRSHEGGWKSGTTIRAMCTAVRTQSSPYDAGNYMREMAFYEWEGKKTNCADALTGFFVNGRALRLGGYTFMNGELRILLRMRRFKIS